MMKLHLHFPSFKICLLYTSDAADERSSVDLGGRRIIKKKKKINIRERLSVDRNNNHKTNGYEDTNAERDIKNQTDHDMS